MIPYVLSPSSFPYRVLLYLHFYDPESGIYLHECCLIISPYCKLCKAGLCVSFSPLRRYALCLAQVGTLIFVDGNLSSAQKLSLVSTTLPREV